MKYKILKGFLCFFIVFSIIGTTNIANIFADELDNVEPSAEGITYQSHVQSYGWQDWKSNGETSGTSGEAKRLEGIKIQGINLPEGVKVIYRTHVQTYGWQNWVSDGAESGTTGEGKRLEAIEIKLEGAPKEYHVEYRTHVQTYGWQEWKRDGQLSGTAGEAKRLEAIEIRLVKEEATPKFSYQSFVTNEGWKPEVTGGVTTGSASSNKIEGVKINLENYPYQIQYRAHIQSLGWDSWKNSGELAGVENQNKRLEALEIKLVNAPADYHVMYRTNIKGYGWQGWKQDGQTTGTTGLGSEIIGLQIKIVQDTESPNVNYQTHVQTYGWQAWKSNGQMSGTSGEAKRLEAIKINLDKLPANNSIVYRTHVQTYGWQDWVADGALSGTEGQGKRLEAIQIQLKNPIEGYQLYYRVHVQSYGWQPWKKSGEIAGTIGEAKRLEGIEIKLVKDKNKTVVIDPGHNYGGDDGAYSTHSGIRYIERDMNMQVAVKLRRELEAKGFKVVMTRETDDRETIAMKESLVKRVAIANNLAADFFISIHQNATTTSSVEGVEVYYSSATPLSGGLLSKKGIEHNEDERAIAPFASNSKVTKSSQLSSAIVNSISKNMSRVNRGSKNEDYYVVKNTYMPAVLLECGFITNPYEAKKLANSALQQTMSELIAIELDKNL